ncbi:MAG: hypothetical protein AB8G23_01745 [Myxococcota bacterium]
MALLPDYSGSFDPNRQLADFSREFLVRLGQEYLLIGHLIDRVSQPLVAMSHGAKGYLTSGVEEWMGASPVYSKRMQRLMNFEGASVETVFKGIQLEVGAPQQFMDFQFRLDSDEYGEFWLAHCGALMDIEPHGERGVKLMCHDIEDPTFDATAAATHPNMVMRPIHRPPRIDGPEGNGPGRHPHCRWKVYLSEDAQPYEQHPNLDLIAGSLLAGVEVDRPEQDGEPGGWSDYSGSFDPAMQLADFSHSALAALAQEFAVQGHLIVRSYHVCVGANWGEAEAKTLGTRTSIGHAALAVERLKRLPGAEKGGIENIAKFIQLHPIFQPRSYVDLRVELTGERSARVAIGNCPALEEKEDRSYFAGLSEAPPPMLEALVRQVDPLAECRPATVIGDERFAWEVAIDPSVEPAGPPDELNLAMMSTGMRFKFEARRRLRS